MSKITRIALVSFILLSSVKGIAQIKTFRIEQKKAERVVVPYDSLTNITRTNLPSLIGQQVQILPQLRRSDLQTGPTLYTSKPTGYNYNSLVVNPDKRFTIYNSQFGSFDNEVFEIVGVDSICDNTDLYRTSKFFLKVTNKKYPTPHYLRIALTTDKIKNGLIEEYEPFYCSDFIILGYFDKLRKVYSGAKLVNKYTDNKGFSTTPIVYDLNTGTALKNIPQNYIWTIKDIAFVDEKNYKGLSYILSSKDYPNCYASYYKDNFIDYNDYVKDITNKRKWETSIRKKYGTANGNLIISGKVKLGFTKAMCRESWGEPNKINRSTGTWGIHEQWVYRSGSYLYFENGRLTAIDN